MLNGISRFFKAIWYKLTGRAHGQADRLMENPEAVRGAYEDIIRFKQNNIQRYKQAIGELIALIEQRKGLLQTLSDDIDELEKMKKEALAEQKNIAAELQKSGTSDENIERHPHYVRCVTSYTDFQSTIDERNVRIASLKRDIDRAQEDIEHHKNAITSLIVNLEKTKTEQSEAVADLITARKQKEISNLLS